MFRQYLDYYKIFKLILGASNLDYEKILPVFNLFYKAGCRFFDIAPSSKIFKNLRKIAPDAFLCVSFVLDGDPHAKKAVINKRKCTKCGLCYKICENVDNILSCTGCGRCVDICYENAICYQDLNSYLNSKMDEMLKLKPDCIELHARGASHIVIGSYLKKLSKYKGVISLCAGVYDFEEIKKAISDIPKYSIIIQADGKPVSGFSDDIDVTIPCVEAAKLYQTLPQYLMVSGGTNSKTVELLKRECIDFKGVAFGSYARKITDIKTANKLILQVQAQN